MTPEEDALGQVVQILEGLGIPYMVTGSLASSHHGRPRTTHDVDMVIDPSPSTFSRLVERLLAVGFSVPVETAKDALRLRRQFNVIEMSSAAKVDLIVRKDRPFSREELRRSRPAELAGGFQARMATPEDTVLSKLEWAQRSGGSEKQIHDVAGILAVQGQTLDRAYIERWAAELGVLDLWRTLTAF